MDSQNNALLMKGKASSNSHYCVRMIS